MTDRSRPLLALVVVAGLVTGGVVLSGRLFLTSGPRSTSAPSPSTPSASSGSGVSATTTGPPTSLGGTLSISGDRQASLQVDNPDRSSDGYTLSGREGRITFFISPDVPRVGHFVYEDLDFFLEPQQCGVVVGEVNPDLGLASVVVRCPDITDIRSKSTVSVEGSLTVAANAVIAHRDDLPEPGGTVTVEGDVSFTIQVADAQWTVFQTDNPRFSPSPQPINLTEDRPLEEVERAIAIDQGESYDDLWVGTLVALGRVHDVPDHLCPVGHEEVGVLAPDATEQRLTFHCADLPVESLGTVDIGGSVVVTRSVVAFPP
ncbi:MAG: hypothetical protein WB239_07745 [Acidimicrobiia bacterium]